MSRRVTLFVTNFDPRMRARDLAYEFERYGRLVRCDIPAPKSPSSRIFAFVEFEDPRDADDAMYELNGRRVDGYRLEIQWAKNTPRDGWRFDGSARSPPRRERRRSRSPAREVHGENERRRTRSPEPRKRTPTPPPRRDDSPRPPQEDPASAPLEDDHAQDQIITGD